MDNLRSAVIFAIALLAVVAFGWYVVSGQSNRQRAILLARTAFGLLRPLGEPGAPTWLRDGGCRFSLVRLKPPFRRVQVVVRPSARVLPVRFPWFGDSQNNRDLIGLAIDAAPTPSIAFELIQPDTAVGLRAWRRATAQGWQATDWTFNRQSLKLLTPDIASAEELLRRLPRLPSSNSIEIIRFAVQPALPHLSLTVAWSESLASSGDSFSTWLARLSDSVTRESGRKVL